MVNLAEIDYENLIVKINGHYLEGFAIYDAIAKSLFNKWAFISTARQENGLPARVTFEQLEKRGLIVTTKELIAVEEVYKVLLSLGYNGPPYVISLSC